MCKNVFFITKYRDLFILFNEIRIICIIIVIVAIFIEVVHVPGIVHFPFLWLTNFFENLFYLTGTIIKQKGKSLGDVAVKIGLRQHYLIIVHIICALETRKKTVNKYWLKSIDLATSVHIFISQFVYLHRMRIRYIISI